MRHNVTTHHARRQRRRGTTATEFAILLPLLVLLCLTSVDFGRFAYAYIALGNAARVGAEFGATHRYSPETPDQLIDQIEDAVREELSGVDCLDPDAVEINVVVEPDDFDLHRVEVTATSPFRTVVAWPSIPRPLELRRTVAFRRFR